METAPGLDPGSIPHGEHHECRKERLPFRDSYQAAHLACAIAERCERITELLIPCSVEASARLAWGYRLDEVVPPFDMLRQAIPAYVRRKAQ